ncbi:MAG: hypothetical protein AB7P49_03630 [Bdellovibrionales bacterium]
MDFRPRTPWPAALPPIAWHGYLLCGFDRKHGMALDIGDDEPATPLAQAVGSCHPKLGLGEQARLYARLERAFPNGRDVQSELLTHYGLRFSDRLFQSLARLNESPPDFQNLVDEKSWGVRDLSPLLAVPSVAEIHPLLSAISELALSKSEGTKAVELAVELHLMGHPVQELLPAAGEEATIYLRQLERWRRPRASANDENSRRNVAEWPWPAHVHGQWHRFGDQTGLEIRIRATSPHDLEKKLERLRSIRDTWLGKD